MPLTLQQFETYARDGYVVVHDVVPRDLIDELCAATVRTAAKLDPEFPADLVGCRDWNEPRLHAALIAFRERDKPGFGELYDTLQVNAVLQMVFAVPELVKVAAAALDERPSGLVGSGHMLRLDVPDDTRNALVWHQDNAHYVQNESGDHGLVALVPMVDVGGFNGMIGVLPGSHEEGAVEHDDPGIAEHASQQLRVPQEVIDRYTEVPIEARQGDLVLCHMDLVHRSGRNTSDGIRFTAGYRFHKALVDDFLPGRVIYRPTRERPALEVAAS